MTELWLLPVAFVTSCLAAVIGMGGGVLLITLMPGLVPTGIILPLHACTQLASNVSRATFGWRQVDLTIIPAFAVGAVLSAWLGSGIYGSFDLQWLPAIIGGLILFFTWVPVPTLRGGGQFALAILGFYQTGLGMIAGATGPLGAAILTRRSVQRDWLVVNTAVYMALNHLLRVVAFSAIGFGLAPWWQLVLGMILAGIAGSWVGTRLRPQVPQLNFQRWFRVVISLLAVRMITLPLLQVM